MAIRTDNNFSNLLKPSHDKILLPGSLAVVNSSRSSILQTSLPVSVFIDNGCTGFALMDIEFAKKFNIPLLPLSTPRPVLMADRTLSSHGPILFQTVPVRLSLGLHVETIEFLITSLSSSDYPG